jgi:hypothetical protein
MNNLIKFFKAVNWKKLLAALAALGVVSTADWKAALISLITVTLVWALNLWARKTGKRIGSEWLTVIVYALSVVVTLVIHPVLLPAFPAWNGEASVFFNDVVAFLTALAPIAAAATGEATLIYNSIFKQVVQQVPALKG